MKSYSQKELIEDLEREDTLYLYFTSKGCGPCKEIKILAEAWEPKQSIVYLINADEAHDLQQELEIVGYPTIAVVKDKDLIELAQGKEQVFNLMMNGKSNK
jgi:thiol-disulfide isomerase/thioredoxin